MSSAIELVNDLVGKINEIDEVLNTEEDAKASSRRRIVSDLIAAQAPKIQPNLDSLIKTMEGVTDEDLPGIFLGFIRGLEKAFGKKVSTLVDAQIPEIDPEAVKKDEVPEDQKNQLLLTRKDLLDKARVIGDLAVTMEEITPEDLEALLPKRRNVAGKRGKRAISWYTLSVGEKTFDNMSEVAKAFGYEKAADLTKAIRETPVGETGKGIDLTNPPKSFSFTLKDGSVLEAVDTRTEDEREEDADSEEAEETE
jgi:hypothetical protein